MLTMTDSERRAGYVNVMGTSLGNLYHDLENEVALLVRKWDELTNSSTMTRDSLLY